MTIVKFQKGYNSKNLDKGCGFVVWTSSDDALHFYSFMKIS